MEKPDANGFVTVNWPSKSIPHGGVFHTRIAQPSVQSQQYLKVLLEESKLSIVQRQKKTWESRLRCEDEPVRARSESQVRVPLVRPTTSRRRSLSAIRESGVLDINDYRPLKRGEDRERMKEKLQSSMAFGDAEQKPPQPAQVAVIPEPPKLPTAKEMKHDLLTQIRERAEWLAEMEVLGEADLHREIVQDQIAERLRALDVLGPVSVASSARSHGSACTLLDEARGRAHGSTVSASSTRRTARSVRSTDCQKKKPIVKGSTWSKTNQEENVSEYDDMPPLKYSPRRRC